MNACLEAGDRVAVPEVNKEQSGGLCLETLIEPTK